MWGVILAYLRKQIGLTSDTASATGSLHAKVENLLDQIETLQSSTQVNSVQRGTITMPTNGVDLTATATISSVNTSKVALRLLGQSSTDAAPRTRIALTNNTTITATKGATGSEAIVVGYEITEFK